MGSSNKPVSRRKCSALSPKGVRTLFLSFLFEMFLDRLIERIIFVTRFLQWNNAVPLLPLYKLVLPRHWEHAECPYRI